MQEIEFSTMQNIDPNSGLGNAFFEPLVRQQGVKVRRTQFEWPEAWNQLVQVGLGSKGPDISEVGSTWLGSFYAM
jgi:hypothetical protein